MKKETERPPSTIKKKGLTTINQSVSDWGLFCISAIVCFVSILILLASSFIRSNGSGFNPSFPSSKSIADVDFISFCFAYVGSFLFLMFSLIATFYFGKVSIRSTNNKESNNGKVAPSGRGTTSGGLWGDSNINCPKKLGGKAHQLIRLLTKIQKKEGVSDPKFHSNINLCIKIVRSSPNLWDADTFLNNETKKEVHSERQTGVWLQSILSATPYWLERGENSDDDDDDDGDEGFEDERSCVEITKERGGKKEKRQKSGRRRSSFTQAIHKIVLKGRKNPIQFLKEDTTLIKLMDSIFVWKFDIFKFDQHTGLQSLVFLTMEAVRRLRLPFNILPKSKPFNSFMKDIQSGYIDNPYHNRLHAADVVQTCGHFLTRPTMILSLKPLDKLSLLVAAAIHDYAHPGTSNGFLVTTSSPIAVRHNDDSPLERFHCAEAFRVMGQDRNCFLSLWSTADKRRFRNAVIQLVLCTDLGLGLGIINQFDLLKKEILGSISKKKQIAATKSDFSIPSENVESSDDQYKKTLSRSSRIPSFGFPKFEYRLLVLKVALRCADISHPAKENYIHQRWTSNINKEFFAQGKKEKELNLPVSPLCEEDGFNLAKSQQGFISFLVKPTFTPFAAFAEGREWIEILDQNFGMWKKMEEDNEEKVEQNQQDGTLGSLTTDKPTRDNCV